MSISNNTNFYYDLHSLDAMRSQARHDKSAALQSVAKQFESIFMRMMVKSMRQANLDDESMMSSEGERFYRDMYDDQLVQELTKNNSLGLADVIIKQLQHLIPNQSPNENDKELKSKPLNIPKRVEQAYENENVKPSTRPSNTEEFPVELDELNTYIASPNSVKENLIAIETKAGDKSGNIDDALSRVKSPKEFVDLVFDDAKKAAKQLNVSPAVLIAQAALETGWGQRVLKKTDGTSSNNLFNIKASRSWNGDAIDREVDEYVDGFKVKDQSKFRAYKSIQDSFSDYVRIVKENERYSRAVNQSNGDEGFIEQLHKAGYATDPDYAAKVKRVMRSDVLSSTENVSTIDAVNNPNS